MGAMDNTQDYSDGFPENYMQDGDLIPRPDPKQWTPTMVDPFPTFRCTKTKSDGTRCKKQAITGMLPESAKCTAHGGKQLSVKEKAKSRVDAARMRLFGNTDMAVEVLEQLAQPGTADNIRLKAATEILDRAGIRGGVEVDVSGEVHINTAEEVRKRLAKLALGHLSTEPDEDILEAEIVTDSDDDDEQVA